MPTGESPQPASPTQVLSWVMPLLVAATVMAGLLLLLPVAIIIRFFPGGPVAVLVTGAVLLLLAPLLYAWRSRPF